MKRKNFWKYSAIAGIVLTFAMAWVNYWAMLAGFVLVCVSLTAYLIAQDVER
jgi:hypothetical protein